MNEYGLTFHHLGLAVNRPDTAFRFLKGLGYQIGGSVTDPLQNVQLSLCHHSCMPCVEVIWPTGPNGPLEGILKQSAAMVYHICYETRSLADSIRSMEQDGNRVVCISEPKPAVLFGGQKVSFYRIPQFGLVELLESPARES
jgi:methylmalonyl-CoA/ethylmalonyl-CoA epimerase